ncbi:MAG TPA: amidohydrolase family protein [Acidimicrobiales bacterium]|nr:amidohydrolase family protein [Acidimicrobiales bacterium]
MSVDVEKSYVVISADCHAGADLFGYRDYLDPGYRDEFDAWAADYEIPYEDLKGEEGGRNWDSERRRRDLESDGIVAEVVFPNTVPPFFRNSSLGSQLAPDSQTELDRRWAGLRAHNRWLADFCAAEPGRRAGVIQLTLHDIEGSVREIEWARSAGLTGGVLLPGAPPGSGLPPLHDRDYYEPLWSACEDAEFPVNCHSGGAAPRPSDTPEGHVLFMLELSWWDQRVLRHLLLGGVLERHPDLHFVFTEAGMSWIPREIQTMEYFFDSMKRPRGASDLSFGEQVVSGLSCRPSEYWRRQCHVGASFMHPSDKAFWDQVGIESIMWGSDYPHVEASFPFSRQAIALTFGGVVPDAVALMLGGNAALLYGFDAAELARAAEGIGPRQSDVSRGITPSEVPPAAAKCPAFAGLLSDSGRLRWADNRKGAADE